MRLARRLSVVTTVVSAVDLTFVVKEVELLALARTVAAIGAVVIGLDINGTTVNDGGCVDKNLRKLQPKTPMSIPA